MKKLASLVAVVAALVVTATAGAVPGSHAMWIGTPTCSATTTTLTCSGKAAGFDPRPTTYAELAASVMWKCDGADIFTNAYTGEAQFTTIHNGESFEISWTPPAVPPEQPSGCLSGTWTRWDSSTGQLGVVDDLVSFFIIQPSSGTTLFYSFGSIYPS
jgi:hypothetical protein